MEAHPAMARIVEKLRIEEREPEAGGLNEGQAWILPIKILARRIASAEMTRLADCAPETAKVMLVRPSPMKISAT